MVYNLDTFLMRPSPKMRNSFVQPDVSLCFAEIYSQDRVKIFPCYKKLYGLNKSFVDLFPHFLCKRENNAEINIAKSF